MSTPQVEFIIHIIRKKELQNGQVLSKTIQNLFDVLRQRETVIHHIFLSLLAGAHALYKIIRTESKHTRKRMLNIF